MMQTLWKYIDDLVGKGLDFLTICQFLWYASASMLMLAMPIAILISSIMTFGNMGERFELVAIKSSGISLLRFMRPILYLTLLLSGITFVFANYVIPYANLKFVSAYSEIYYKKPAFDLKEGIFFTHIPNYAIKVNKKDADGKTIHQVIIFEQGNNLQDNCIIAEKGVMNISADDNFLEFNLENGTRYQEKGNITDSATEFTRLHFKKFKKLFDVSVLKKQETNDSIYKGDFRIQNYTQLSKNIDSFKNIKNNIIQKIKDNQNNEFKYTHAFAQESNMPVIKNNPIDYHSIVPPSMKFAVKQQSILKLNQLKNSLNASIADLNATETAILFNKIEWQRKFSMSLSCLVLFLIGAPLGAIIRKGGLGMPLVIAIIFFLIFHLLMIFGEKFVNQGIFSPFVGMWLPIIVLLPVGILFTYKAMHDSKIFNAEFYKLLFKRKK
jgi:lipopolysaccharide export system permease protein